MASPFELMVDQLKELGFFGYLLPFLLMFVISFGLLSKTKVLGEDKKVIAVASSLLAFIVLGFGSIVFGNFLVNLFGLGAGVLAGILVIALLIGMAGGDISKLFGESKMLLALVGGIGILVFVLALSSIGVVLNNAFVATVFFVIVILIAVSMIAGGKS